ncbi:uncharacterized protein LOC126455468 [Schistocerca serialis cubense]|uniref:uncharacterized protein LOC126455468 n=1 Tax=Schistocerca serialis cubense TaxID=2023355 RepID=UPI00214E57BE|nr:uncharacterized protein LOC126455468 [Schistocerca serialis cubense]
MSRGYYVPCAPFLYLVPDSGGMDCMPLQPAHAHQPHRPPGPFQYLMHEQAKSLVALQELQNEVGALLEFRDLVMETFPHLRQKLAASERGGSSSSCCTSTASSTAATLPPAHLHQLHHAAASASNAASASPSGAASRHRPPAADWEPGVRVRRKLLHGAAHHKEITGGSDGASSGATHRKQPKSGDGSGTSSAGSSAVQDSGFGTETSSSKAASATTVLPPAHHHQASSSSVVVDEAEDELWNLLDVIQRKGTRLRDEVAQLQQRLAGSAAPAPSAPAPSAPAAEQPQQQVRPPPPPTPRPRRPLGALDAILSAPSTVPRARPDARKVAAILRELDPVELQRHLLTTTAHNQALQNRLEKTAKLHTSLLEQLDKVKDENDDLRFQLAEKSIELEGTKARMRVLQQRQGKAAETNTAAVSTETDDEQPPLLPPEETCNPILPLLALPVAGSDDHNHQHHSSSTESAHDHTEQRRVQSSNSPRRRPSKIPLLGTKSYCAPRPPSGKTGAITAAHSNKSRDSLSAKSGRETSWKSKADGASLSGSKSREPISVVRNSSLSARNNSRESLNGSKSRDSILSKSRSDSVNGRKVSAVEVTMVSTRSRDGHSQNSFSSNASNTNKRDSLSGKSREASFSSSSGWKGTQHPVRRASSASITRGNVIDQADRNSKVLTASDSLEPKQCSSATGETHGSHHDDHHDADSFSDSLNHFPDQEVELSPKTSDEIDFKSLTSQLNLQSQDVNSDSNIIVDGNSSSSEFFDSINDSESVLNNEIVSSKNVHVQDHHLHTSSRCEGLTECDSLENRAPEMMIEAFHTPTKFLSKVISTRNFCITPGGQHTEY